MTGGSSWFGSVLKTFWGRPSRLPNFPDLCISSPGLRLNAGLPERFLSSHDITLNDLIDTLIQLRGFRRQYLEYNDLVEQRARGLPWGQLRQLEEIGYLDKLSLVRCALDTNNLLIEQIIGSTINSLVRDNTTSGSIEYADEISRVCHMFGFELVKDANGILVRYDSSVNNVDYQTAGGNPYRVNEAISHLGRDYSPEFNSEVLPLLEYVEKILKMEVLPVKRDSSERNLIVVPGSGTGYVSLKLAELFPDITVESIELSMLMFLCNEFILSDSESMLRMCPFATNYSSQTDVLNQIREVEFQCQRRPTNLNVLCGDFTEYSPPKQDRIMVVTVYFMDTAENIFTYMDSIERLSEYCHELHWINIGPLKYGTKPKVQLTAKEFQELREIRGWKDTDNDLQGIDDTLSGYLTDKEALYQGFYKLVKFHSVFSKTTRFDVKNQL